MDPQQPPQTPVSPPVQTPPTENMAQPPAPKTPSNKKTLFIILGSVILALIVIGVGIKLLVDAMSSQNKPATVDNSLYYNRDGYNPSDYGKTIGDPLALTMDKLDAPVKSSTGSAILYACNLITIKELNDQKAYLDPRSDAKAVTRNYVDGVGKQNVETSTYTLPSADEENRCDYSLQSSTILSLTVHQPPFTAKEAVDDQLDRLYTRTDSINGLQTYKYKRGTDSTDQYMMKSGDTAVEVLFNGTKMEQDKQSQILTTIAKNMTDQQTTSKGPALAAYDTPTFTKKYARACDFISNDDIKTLTGSDASIFANEALASATGVAQADGKLYNSITTACSRFNTGLGSGIGPGKSFDQKLEVTMISFNDEAGAKYYMTENMKDRADKTSMSAGDEAFGYRDTADQNAAVVRQGRFIVEIMFDRTVQQNAKLQDTAAMTQKLTPYAQQVASKLEPMQ